MSGNTGKFFDKLKHSSKTTVKFTKNDQYRVGRTELRSEEAAAPWGSRHPSASDRQVHLDGVHDADYVMMVPISFLFHEWMVEIKMKTDTAFILGIGFLTAMGGAVLAPLLPEIQSQFGLSLSEIGMLSSAFGLARLLLDLPTGFLISRYNPMTIQIVGVIIVIVSSLAAAMADSFLGLLAARGVSGIGAGMVAVANMVLIASVGEAARRGRDLGYYQAATQTAFSIGPFFAGLMVPFAGWQGAFYATAAFSVLALVAMLMIRPHSGSQVKTVKDPAKQEVKLEQTEDLDHASRQTRYWNALAAHLATFVLFFTARGFSSSILPLYGGNVIGLSAAVIGLAMGVNSVMRIVLSVIGGHVADRYGYKVLLVPGLIILALIMALLPFVTTAVGFFVFAAALGLARFGNNIPAALLADNVESAGWGRAMGLNRFLADLAVVLGPVVLGYIVDLGGGQYAWAGYFCCVVTFGCALLIQVVVRESRTTRTKPHLARNMKET